MLQASSFTAFLIVLKILKCGTICTRTADCEK